MASATHMDSAPASHLSEQDAKCLKTTQQNGKTLFARGYDVHLVCDPVTGEIRQGVYCVVKPGSTPVFHIVDLIAGTCSGDHPCCFSRLGTCLHVIAVRNLVFHGVADGMPAEWIAQYYQPELNPHPDLLPEQEIAEPVQEPVAFAAMQAKLAEGNAKRRAEWFA